MTAMVMSRYGKSPQQPNPSVSSPEDQTHSPLPPLLTVDPIATMNSKMWPYLDMDGNFAGLKGTIGIVQC